MYQVSVYRTIGPLVEAFNSKSRYLDDILDIVNPYFEGMVNQIYPPELQLSTILDLHLSSSNGFCFL